MSSFPFGELPPPPSLPAVYQMRRDARKQRKKDRKVAFRQAIANGFDINTPGLSKKQRKKLKRRKRSFLNQEKQKLLKQKQLEYLEKRKRKAEKKKLRALKEEGLLDEEGNIKKIEEFDGSKGPVDEEKKKILLAIATKLPPMVPPPQAQESTRTKKKLRNLERPRDPRVLYCGNLGPGTNQAYLRELFGIVDDPDVERFKFPDSKRSLCHITFKSEGRAQALIDKFNESIVHGYPLKLELGYVKEKKKPKVANMMKPSKLKKLALKGIFPASQAEWNPYAKNPDALEKILRKQLKSRSKKPGEVIRARMLLALENLKKERAKKEAARREENRRRAAQGLPPLLEEEDKPWDASSLVKQEPGDNKESNGNQAAPSQMEVEVKQEKTEEPETKEKNKKRKRDETEDKAESGEDDKKDKKKKKKKRKTESEEKEDESKEKDKKKKKKKAKKDEGEVKKENGEEESGKEKTKKKDKKKKRKRDEDEAEEDTKKSKEKKDKKKKKKQKQKKDDEEEEKEKKPEQTAEEKAAEERAKAESKPRTVVVSNFPYETTEEEIKAFLTQKVGPIDSMKLAVYSKTGLSKGKATVVFKNKKYVKKALALDREKYQGRLLFVDPLGAKRKDVKIPRNTENTCGSKTIHVANLPPDVTKEELTEVFNNCGAGTVTGIRLMQKSLDGEMRTVAFIQYFDAQFVEEAVKLHGTMLRGRKMKIKYGVERFD